MANMALGSSKPVTPTSATENTRPMVRAELMGSHSHDTLCGVEVHVWMRGGKYLARGSYQRQRFGEDLGSDVTEATARLRELLTEIDHGSYVRPSESRNRPLSKGKVSRLSVRQLVDEFLVEKRRLKGQRTAATYRSRLRPVLDFAEQPAARRRWPLAMDVDRDFVIELRGFLFDYQTTRNGRLGSKPKPMSVRQIKNVLECLRSALGWAQQAEVRKLPADWGNPLKAELIPRNPPKDPLREDPLPLEARIKLVGLMDRWQLCHLALSVVLPLRPEEAAGRLISDVNFDKGWLVVGTRLQGDDFTKGRTSFVLPFPDELRPILAACIAGRAEGPLLRSRKVFEGRTKVRVVGSFEELRRLYQETLDRAPRERVATEQDRKQVFRRLLYELGGVSEDRLAAEFKHLLLKCGLEGLSLKRLRHSATKAMKDANLPHLEMLYLTSHSTTSILNEYTPVNPVGAMQSYFEAIRPLLTALTQRAGAVGLRVG